MAWKTIIESAIVRYPQFTMTGPIEYESDLAALAHIDETTGEVEVLSTDLRVYGLVPGPGEVFVKNWSEHAGFAASLQKAGIIEVVGEVLVGPFSSLACRVRVLRPISEHGCDALC
ncbi:hypothetical protein [Brachybacterium sp. UNK5269]|uniref:hypothetical protein n=1 Tax=Brachybacterium sp. UNK5269 TaxID=3408576 RepID=UPI003BB07759